MTLDELNRVDPSRATAEFMRCCGATAWAAAMTAARPFSGLEAMRRRADEIWASLGRRDWLEAFAAHPRIGEQRGATPWSTAEQSGVASAGDEIVARLAEMNHEYERRFGYIFIVCATGRQAGEMLALVDARMTNDPERELGIAAEEQRKITALRLAKLLDAPA